RGVEVDGNVVTRWSGAGATRSERRAQTCADQDTPNRDHLCPSVAELRRRRDRTRPCTLKWPHDAAPTIPPGQCWSHAGHDGRAASIPKTNVCTNTHNSLCFADLRDHPSLGIKFALIFARTGYILARHLVRLCPPSRRMILATWHRRIVRRVG